MIWNEIWLLVCWIKRFKQFKLQVSLEVNREGCRGRPEWRHGQQGSSQRSHRMEAAARTKAWGAQGILWAAGVENRWHRIGQVAFGHGEWSWRRLCQSQLTGGRFDMWLFGQFSVKTAPGQIGVQTKLWLCGGRASTWHGGHKWKNPTKINVKRQEERLI